jgi:uncharacterized OsmC-like protein
VSDPERLKTVFERNRKAVELRPSIARSTSTTRITVRDGTTCEVEHGKWSFTADVGDDAGGNDAGPGPGVLERAALGSCLAIGYATWAAVMEVPLDSIRIEVESEFDARAQFGVGDGHPGFDRLRYTVFVKSPAPDEDVRAVLDAADEHSPVRDDFTRAIPIERIVRIE